MWLEMTFSVSKTTVRLFRSSWGSELRVHRDWEDMWMGMPGLPIFFFQAEDGIRDWSVTGVQTCALPICVASQVQHRERLGRVHRVWGAPPRLDPEPVQAEGRGRLHDVRAGGAIVGLPRFLGAAAEPVLRSEERRVGKECRSRGSRQLDRQ